MWRDILRAIPVSVWKEAKRCCKCIKGNFVSFTLLAGLIAAKIFGLYAFPEIMDLLWQRTKSNTRSLTTTEEKEARKVFGESINYSKVRIDEFSFIAWIGAKMNRCLNMGVTTFHTINFNRKIRTEAGNADMKWLIHELTHIAQMEHCGSKYLVEAIYAQATEGYAYKLGSKLHLSEYNREQQASIVADYYIIHSSGGSTAAYDPYITQLRVGEL
jgi:hypothetical protein